MFNPFLLVSVVSMVIQILSVYDAKAEAFGSPFFSQSIGQAERSFGDEVRRSDPQNMIFLHPEDFQLFHLGSFDDFSAGFDLVSPPRLIASGSSFVRS